MIGDHPQEFLIIVNLDTRVFCSIPASDFCGRIGAAVINDGAFPVLIALRQDAFDAFRKMVSSVVDRSDYAYQRLRWSRFHID
jgi:hypothetical protein